MTGHVHLWEDDHHCYVCGENNPEGMKLQFAVKDAALETAFTAEKRHQGYKDVLHGGILAMILDEVMVLLPYRLFGTVVASGEMTVKLKRPVEVGSRITVRATFAASDTAPVAGQRVYRCAADARLDDGVIVATATATCVKVR